MGDTAIVVAAYVIGGIQGVLAFHAGVFIGASIWDRRHPYALDDGRPWFVRYADRLVGGR